MNKRLYFGIDPGKTGALAWICLDTVSLDRLGYGVVDLPIIKVSETSKNVEVDPLMLKKIILDVCNEYALTPQMCFMTLEHVWAMPPQGSNRSSGITSAASLANSMTCVKTVTKLMEIPFTLVVPRVWKRFYQIPSDKEIARETARLHFPRVRDLLKYKKNADRAEALLIAEYGLLTEVE